jgi:exonuclease III
MEQPGEGIAWVLFNIHQGVVIKEDTLDNDRRVLSCEIKIENQTYKLSNIYCPNNNPERKQFIVYIDIFL